MADYSLIRPTIKTGDVLAWTHRWQWTWYDFQCMVVRAVTMSEYSHVGIAAVIEGRVWVLESVTPVARLVPLSSELPCYLISADELTREQFERGIGLIGKARYSKWEAIRGYFGRNSLRNRDWQCAEFVKHIKDLDCKATPSAVVEHLLTLGYPLTKIEQTPPVVHNGYPAERNAPEGNS